MRTLLFSLTFLALCSAGAQATTPADAPASDASIRELMTVRNTRAMLDQVFGQLDPLMKDAMQQATAGHPPNAEQQKIGDEMRARMVDTLKQDLNWESLEPMYLDIYRKTFTQGEIDGMLKFYKTPAGKAMIAKMPLALQNTMSAMQEHMKVLMPKIREVAKEYGEKLQAARTAEPPADPAKP